MLYFILLMDCFGEQHDLFILAGRRDILKTPNLKTYLLLKTITDTGPGSETGCFGAGIKAHKMVVEATVFDRSSIAQITFVYLVTMDC